MEISIGKLADAFGLSDEALRYYEKKGLLHPERKASGYRVFQQSDIQLVANVKRLQNQAFTLEETRSIYSGSDEETLVSLYAEKIAELHRSIAYQKRVLARMEESFQTLRSLPQQMDIPCRCKAEPVYLLEYPSSKEMWSRIPNDPLLQKLLQHFPIVSFTTVVEKNAFEGEPIVPSKGVCCFERDLFVLDVDPESMRRIDAKNTVSCLFRLENGNFDVGKIVKTLRIFLDKQNLRASDAAFTVFSSSFVDKHGSAIHYARMFVPVEER